MAGSSPTEASSSFLSEGEIYGNAFCQHPTQSEPLLPRCPQALAGLCQTTHTFLAPSDWGASPGSSLQAIPSPTVNSKCVCPWRSLAKGTDVQLCG